MITTTIMFFKNTFSKKYGQYISTAHKDGVTYSLAKDDTQLTGYLEVDVVTPLSPVFSIVKARQIKPDTLSLTDINTILDEMLCEAKDCSIVDMQFVNVKNSCVFKRDDAFYIADITLPHAVPLDIITSLEEVYLPYDIAVYIAMYKKLADAEYDGTYVYDNDHAYTVNDMKIITLPKNFTPKGKSMLISENDVKEFMRKNYVCDTYSSNKVYVHKYNVFGHNIQVKSFSRNGLSLEDYMYGSPAVIDVQDSFNALADFKAYAVKNLGLKAIDEIVKLSKDRILGC